MTRGETAAHTNDWGRRAFSQKRRRAISALVEAMFSREDAVGLHPAPRELAARVTDEFDLLIGSGSGDLGRGFRLLIWLIEWLPIFFIGIASRASRLPLGHRVGYLHKLEHARIALLAT